MATSNKDMGNLLRKRRDEMADLPAYEAPGATSPTEELPTPSDETSEASPQFTVAAPGEPSPEGERFEYEPMTDIPGAWVVYPPGVPCDDTEYRIQMDSPAGKDDFPKMQQALDDAGATTTEPTTSAVPEPGLEEGY